MVQRSFLLPLPVKPGSQAVRASARGCTNTFAGADRRDRPRAASAGCRRRAGDARMERLSREGTHDSVCVGLASSTNQDCSAACCRKPQARRRGLRVLDECARFFLRAVCGHASGTPTSPSTRRCQRAAAVSAFSGRRRPRMCRMATSILDHEDVRVVCTIIRREADAATKGTRTAARPRRTPQRRPRPSTRTNAETLSLRLLRI